MPYIGRGIETLSDRVVLDSLTASATASYTLQLNSVNFVPSSASSLTVSLNGVIQKPESSYTVSSSTLTFSSALTSSDSIDFIIAERDITLQTPSAGSVNTEQLAANAVSSAKMFSGFANGITMVDQFRLTANLTNPGSANITANLERVDDASFSKMGTGMTESSGVFTFPSTGLYRIQAIGLFHIASGNDGAAELVTSVSSDSGSNYDVMAMAISGNLSGSQSYNTHSSEAFVNVTNASTFRAKFETGSFAACTLVGNTDYNQTSFSFIRLGDSQ